jgi:hypothetical protein
LPAKRWPLLCVALFSCAAISAVAQDEDDLPPRPFFRLLEPNRSAEDQQWYERRERLEHALEPDAWDAEFTQQQWDERRLSILQRLVEHTQGTKDYTKWVREYTYELCSQVLRDPQSKAMTRITEFAGELRQRGLTDEAAYAEYWGNSNVRMNCLEKEGFDAYLLQTRKTILEFLSKYPTCSISDVATYELITCYECLGDDASAVRWCRTFVERFPISDHRASVAGKISRLTSIGRQLDLVFQDSHGKLHATNEFRGRVVVLLFVNYVSQLDDVTSVLRKAPQADSPNGPQWVCVRGSWGWERTPQYPLESVIDVCCDGEGGIDEQLGNPLGLTAMILDPSGTVVARDVPASKLSDALKTFLHQWGLVVGFSAWNQWSIVRPQTATPAAGEVLSKDSFRRLVATLAPRRKTALIVWDKRTQGAGVAERALRPEIEGILRDLGYLEISFRHPDSTVDGD